MSEARSGGAVAFALIYLTFFLDNVLLTVLVPIIPEWVGGEAPAAAALWGQLATNRTAPAAAALHATGGGVSQAALGAVLGAKAGAQLAAAAPAARVVCARGPAPALRAATATLALAALALWCCGGLEGRGAAACVVCARVLHGAGAALAGVAGLALAAQARPRGIGALLGAVALGVLVGYPFGGVTYALWSRGAPFLLLAAVLLADLAMQYMLLNEKEFNQARGGGRAGGAGGAGGAGLAALRGEARRGATSECAGAVLLTASVMAALEPCLPLWIMDKFHPQRWELGAVFVPDSAGYFVATSALGGAARALGAERAALAGQLAVAAAALAVPHATSVSWLAVPHVGLGLGLGALDVALVPALLARRPHRAPARAALLQAASSAAAAIGPVVGGVVSWCVGFESLLRALGVANLLYAALLYRALAAHPLSEQWGASAEEEDSDEEWSEEAALDTRTHVMLR